MLKETGGIKYIKKMSKNHTGEKNKLYETYLKLIYLLFDEQSDSILANLKVRGFEHITRKDLSEKYHISKASISKRVGKQFKILKEFVNFYDDSTMNFNNRYLLRLLSEKRIINYSDENITLSEYFMSVDMIDLTNAIAQLSEQEIDLMLIRNMNLYQDMNITLEEDTYFNEIILNKLKTSLTGLNRKLTKRN